MKEIEMSMKQDLLTGIVKKATEIFKKEEPLTEVAFRFLFNPIKENLYNYIFKALSFSEDANDVYQETVLRAFKYRQGYRRENSFKTWIFAIAHNEIRTYFNKNKKNQMNTNLEEHLEDTELSKTPTDTRIHDIYEVAQQLNPRHRQIFFLFYDQRFSISEISGITGLKQGNIKFILNQARERIKQQLNLRGE